MKDTVITLRTIINELKSYKDIETCFVPPELSGHYYKIIEKSYFTGRYPSDCIYIKSRIVMKIINNVAHTFYHYNKNAEIELLECRPNKDVVVMSFTCYDYRISISLFITNYRLPEGEININNMYRHIISNEHLQDRDKLNRAISESLVTHMTQYGSDKYDKELSLWNN